MINNKSDKTIAFSIGTTIVAVVAMFLTALNVVKGRESSGMKSINNADDSDDYDDFEDYDEPDESYAAEDYISSRPWGLDNNG